MMNPKQVFALVAVGCLAFVMACNKPPEPAPVDATSAQGANTATPPRVLRRVKAEFPKALWSKPGTVSVRAMVGIDGKVGETKVVSSPHPELSPLALDAVKQWQFDPARKDGKPIAVPVTVNVEFQPPAAPATSQK
jgi:TonB family protein